MKMLHTSATELEGSSEAMKSRKKLEHLSAGILLLPLALSAIDVRAENNAGPAVPSNAPSVTNLSAVARPETGKVSATDIHESDNMVARMMRLGPGASSKEHHHPFFDEAIVSMVKWIIDPRTEICHSSAGS
ncbi:hypothetical protein [Polyangium jinanense]|uniref:Uncharacterized protein n=2 Tax=Polyangium jinanense TaxID=2829994 RepID=A0A9X4AUV4_9BACT|nr:hypothetical protein [Polyangium jinanense]MDC3985026.1 hypothetical protein [Polyangium jinanense]